MGDPERNSKSEVKTTCVSRVPPSFVTFYLPFRIFISGQCPQTWKMKRGRSEIEVQNSSMVGERGEREEKMEAKHRQCSIPRSRSGNANCARIASANPSSLAYFKQFFTTLHLKENHKGSFLDHYLSCGKKSFCCRKVSLAKLDRKKGTKTEPQFRKIIRPLP